MKIYYISIKRNKKGPSPVETITTSAEDKDNIVKLLMDKGNEVIVSERTAQTFAEYKASIEEEEKKATLLKSIMTKLSEEEYNLITKK